MKERRFSMKLKTIITSIFLTLIISSIADAAPYYRLWQGWKLDSIDYEGLRRGLDERFIPATVEVGMGRGLMSYLPALAPLPEKRPEVVRKLLPDEIALVVYDSEANYRSIRNTPQGEAYGALHWEYFDKDKGSKSTLPEKYLGKLEPTHAYDVLGSVEHWQNGYAVYVMSLRKQDASPYVDQMRRDFFRNGLKSYLVLVEESYVIEYQLWRDKSSFDAAESRLEKARAKFLTPIRDGNGNAKKSSPYKSKIKYGEGLNVQFDHQEKVTSIDPLSYSENATTIEAENSSDMEPYGVEECALVNEREDTQLVECRGYKTILVFGGHDVTVNFECKFYFSKTSTGSHLVNQNCD
jgi:hypothetical protein